MDEYHSHAMLTLIVPAHGFFLLTHTRLWCGLVGPRSYSQYPRVSQCLPLGPQLPLPQGEALPESQRYLLCAAGLGFRAGPGLAQPVDPAAPSHPCGW